MDNNQFFGLLGAGQYAAQAMPASSSQSYEQYMLQQRYREQQMQAQAQALIYGDNFENPNPVLLLL